MKLRKKWTGIFFGIMTTLALHGAANAATSPLCPHPCDAPSLPKVGYEALAASHKDAYGAVDRLLPAARADDLAAQISITYIIEDWLNGKLPGRSSEPFTRREEWYWWHLVAYKSQEMAELLGGAYSEGAPGLPKNEKLANCLVVEDSRPLDQRVRDCFKRFAVKAN